MSFLLIKRLRYAKLPSVRAWRGLRFNEKYAAKLEKKLARKREVEAVKTHALTLSEQKKTEAKINPFSVRLQLLCAFLCLKTYR